MRLSRLRNGERLALAGAIALAVLLGFDWFFLSTPDARVGAHESGIRSLGWFATLLVLAAIVAAISMAVATATQRAPAWPVVLTIFTVALGTLATLAIGIRLIAQPGLGVDAGNADVEVELAAWLGFLAAFAMTAGAWLGMVDERLDSAEARDQTEDVLRVRGAPRPAPPATAAAGQGPAPDAPA